MYVIHVEYSSITRFKLLCICVTWYPLKPQNFVWYCLFMVQLVLCIRETLCDMYIMSVISLCQSAQKGANKNYKFFQPSRNSLVISNEDGQVSPPRALEQTPPAVVVFESLIHPHLVQQTLHHLQTLFPCACCHRKLETAVEEVCWNLPKEDLAYSYSPAITESIFLN